MGYDYIINDLLRFKPFRKRYETERGRDSGYWSGVARRYSSALALVESLPWRWYVIAYRDGREELAYLRVLNGGLFTGKRPAIYRGAIIPHRICLGTFAHVKELRIAF